MNLAYHWHEAVHAGLQPAHGANDAMRLAFSTPFNPLSYTRHGRAVVATCELAVGAPPPPFAPLEALKPLPPKMKTVVKSSAEGILGQPVHDAKGHAIGNSVDVLIDPEVRPQAAVIEFAGFLAAATVMSRWTAPRSFFPWRTTRS